MTKKGVFLLLCTLLQNGSKEFPNFCMNVEDNRAHCLSKIVSLKKFLIPDYWVSSNKGDVIDIDIFTALALYHWCTNEEIC